MVNRNYFEIDDNTVVSMPGTNEETVEIIIYTRKGKILIERVLKDAKIIAEDIKSLPSLYEKDKQLDCSLMPVENPMDEFGMRIEPRINDNDMQKWKEAKEKNNNRIDEIIIKIQCAIDIYDEIGMPIEQYDIKNVETLEFIKELEKQRTKFKINTPITNPDVKRRLMDVIDDNLYINEQEGIIETNKYKIKKAYSIATICFIVMTISYVLGINYVLKSIEEISLLLKGLTILGPISLGAGTAFITHELNKERSRKIEGAECLKNDKLKSLRVSKNSLLTLASPTQTKAPSCLNYHFDPSEQYKLDTKGKLARLSAIKQDLMDRRNYESENKKRTLPQKKIGPKPNNGNIRM